MSRRTRLHRIRSHTLKPTPRSVNEMQPNFALAIASSHGHPTHATHTIWSSHTASFHPYRRLGPAHPEPATQSNAMAVMTGYMPSYAILVRLRMCFLSHSIGFEAWSGMGEGGGHSKGCGKLHLIAHAGPQPRAPSLELGQIPLAALEQKQKMPWVCARLWCMSLLLLAPRKPPAGPVRARLGREVWAIGNNSVGRSRTPHYAPARKQQLPHILTYSMGFNLPAHVPY